MALTPKLCAYITDNCTKLVIKDITEAYDADLNVGGWGSPNITTGNIYAVVINLVNSLGEGTSYEIDFSNFPATVTGDFTIVELEIDPLLDGEYIIEYVITDTDAVEISSKIKIFSTCNVRCCIDKMWSNFAESREDCSCGCSSLSNNALQAEALYRAMLSSSACLDSTVRTTLLKKLQRICELENCNCK